MSLHKIDLIPKYFLVHFLPSDLKIYYFSNGLCNSQCLGRLFKSHEAHAVSDILLGCFLGINAITLVLVAPVELEKH